MPNCELVDVADKANLKYVQETLAKLYHGDCPKCGGEVQWLPDSSAAMCHGRCTKDGIPYTFMFEPTFVLYVDYGRKMTETMEALKNQSVQVARNVCYELRDIVPHAFSDPALAERIDRSVYKTIGVEEEYRAE